MSDIAIHSDDGGSAGLAQAGMRVAGAEVDTIARSDPVPRRHHGELRRLQGALQPVAHDRGRRAALHHRAQRRRQDDDDGRDHRQDATRRGHRVLRPDDRPDADDRGRDRARGHRPQVPEAHGVRAALGVREPGARDESRQARAQGDQRAARARRPRPHRRDARADPALRRSRPPRRTRCRTARSSGWRSACC